MYNLERSIEDGVARELDARAAFTTSLQVLLAR
jgi:hypothetical protein